LREVSVLGWQGGGSEQLGEKKSGKRGKCGDKNRVEEERGKVEKWPRHGDRGGQNSDEQGKRKERVSIQSQARRRQKDLGKRLYTKGSKESLRVRVLGGKRKG